jgi:hypothetical protein
MKDVLPLEIAFEERPGYLYVRVSAMHTNQATAEHYLERIAEKCAEVSADKLLIFRDITDSLDIPAMYWVATRMADVLKGVRVAFVNPHHFNDPALKFGRDLILQRQGTIELFSKEADAIDWLLAS